MRLKLILAIHVTLTALFLVLLSPAAGAQKYTFPFHKELPTEAPAFLEIQNTSGEIRIESHPQNKIIIDAFKVVEADDYETGASTADQIEVVIRKHDSKVEVKTKYSSQKSKKLWKRLFGLGPKGWGQVDYHILVPEKTEVSVLNTSGDVTISDISGVVEVSATSGDLYIKRIKGNLNLETTSGDIEIFGIEGDVLVQGTSSDLEIIRVTGDVDISSTSGNTSAEDIAGSVEIDKTSGDVYLKRIKGDIRASSSSGDLTVEQMEGGLDLETSSGDVQVKTEISFQYQYYVKTSSGYIDFSLPQDSDARIRLKTSSGSIKCDLPLTLHSISRDSFKGELGAGGSEIHLVTSSGDIELREHKR